MKLLISSVLLLTCIEGSCQADSITAQDNYPFLSGIRPVIHVGYGIRTMNPVTNRSYFVNGLNGQPTESVIHHARPFLDLSYAFQKSIAQRIAIQAGMAVAFADDKFTLASISQEISYKVATTSLGIFADARYMFGKSKRNGLGGGLSLDRLYLYGQDKMIDQDIWYVKAKLGIMKIFKYKKAAQNRFGIQLVYRAGLADLFGYTPGDDLSNAMQRSRLHEIVIQFSAWQALTDKK